MIKRIKKIKKKKFIFFKPNSSKIELEFGLFLKKNNINIEPQFKIGYKFFDFKVKGKNILIEFQGDFYHCSPKFYPTGPINTLQKKNIQNDKIKRTLAEANGFKVLYFWEDDFKNNKFLIINELKSEGLI